MHPIAKILLKIGVFANLTMGFTSIAQTNNEAEFEAFLKKRQSEFSQFEQQQKQEFEAFVSAWHDAQNAYLKQVTTKWQDPNLPSSKVWVKYSDDLNKRTSVNFESGEVVVEPEVPTVELGECSTDATLISAIQGSDDASAEVGGSFAK